jgi:hypothetical protein
MAGNDGNSWTKPWTGCQEERLRRPDRRHHKASAAARLSAEACDQRPAAGEHRSRRVKIRSAKQGRRCRCGVALVYYSPSQCHSSTSGACGSNEATSRVQRATRKVATTPAAATRRSLLALMAAPIDAAVETISRCDRSSSTRLCSCSRWASIMRSLSLIGSCVANPRFSSPA